MLGTVPNVLVVTETTADTLTANIPDGLIESDIVQWFLIAEVAQCHVDVREGQVDICVGFLEN